MKRRVVYRREVWKTFYIAKLLRVFLRRRRLLSRAKKKPILYAFRHDRERHTHTQKSSLLSIQIETRATTTIPKAGLLKSTPLEVRPVGADKVQLNRESTIIVLVLYSHFFPFFFMYTLKP